MPETIDHDSGRPIDVGPEAQGIARLAWLLDSCFRVPGTKFRFGLDALIGLVPGLGDVVGVLFSGYILKEAWRLGASKSLLAHMALNIGIEGLVGAVPLLGDLFDMVWKANQRNMRLLQGHLSDPARTRRSSRGFLVGLLLGFFGLLALLAIVMMAAMGFLVRWLMGA